MYIEYYCIIILSKTNIIYYIMEGNNFITELLNKSITLDLTLNPMQKNFESALRVSTVMYCDFPN